MRTTEATTQAEYDLLSQAYAAFNRRDIHAALALMQPDVEWPNGMEGGHVHGHNGVRDYWTRQWTLIDPTVEPVRFERVDDGGISVEVHQVVRDLNGKTLSDQIVHHVYVIQDGLIMRTDIR